MGPKGSKWIAIFVIVQTGECVISMKHVHFTDIPAEIPSEEDVKDTTIRWLITKKDGAENFTMRLFEMKPDGHTPLHQHDWEHEVFIVKGSGELRTKTEKKPFKQGDVVFVEPMEWHQFANTGSEILQFICVIPYK
jgi:quercetin dioxygenase-like cupin family protein